MIVVLLIADTVVAVMIGYLVGCRRASQQAVDTILDRELDHGADAAGFLAALRPADGGHA